MIGTRLYLCYSIIKLFRSLFNPTKAHLGIAKHIIRYIKGRLDYYVKFIKCKEKLKLRIVIHIEQILKTEHLNNNSALISWKSRRQIFVRLNIWL